MVQEVIQEAFRVWKLRGVLEVLRVLVVLVMLGISAVSGVFIMLGVWTVCRLLGVIVTTVSVKSH